MKILPGLLAALLLAGCATGISKPPSVSVAGMDIDSLGLFEQRFVLKLRVKNLNDVDIPVDGLDLDVELNGKPFANGVSNAAVIVPRLGESVLDVPITSNLAAFLRRLPDPEHPGSPDLDYRVKGRLRVSGHGLLPFDHRGQVPWLPSLLLPEGGAGKSRQDGL
jgi:LEA14-like dessication related protein